MVYLRIDLCSSFLFVTYKIQIDCEDWNKLPINQQHVHLIDGKDQGCVDVEALTHVHDASTTIDATTLKYITHITILSTKMRLIH
jgi:hypothetical protein